MRRIGWLWIALGLLVIWALPLAAQTTFIDDEIPLGSARYFVTVPDGWDVEQSNNGLTTIFITEDGLEIQLVLDNVFLPFIRDLASDVTAADILEAVYVDMYQLEFDPNNVVERSAPTGAQATYSYQADNLSIAVRFADGSFAFVEVYALAGEVTSQQASAVESLLNSIRVDESIVIIPTATTIPTIARASGSNNAQPPTPTSEPTPNVAVGSGLCFITVEQSGVATLRVGPGFNRSAIAFLPARQVFAVESRELDRANNLWFQVNKDEAVPNTAAAELWVVADDVLQTGDCAAPTQE